MHGPSVPIEWSQRRPFVFCVVPVFHHGRIAQDTHRRQIPDEPIRRAFVQGLHGEFLSVLLLLLVVIFVKSQLLACVNLVLSEIFKQSLICQIHWM